jgi:hypothetical protein
MATRRIIEQLFPEVWDTLTQLHEQLLFRYPVIHQVALEWLGLDTQANNDNQDG